MQAFKDYATGAVLGAFLLGAAVAVVLSFGAGVAYGVLAGAAGVLVLEQVADRRVARRLDSARRALEEGGAS
jgi:hypothetical protein